MPSNRAKSLNLPFWGIGLVLMIVWMCSLVLPLQLTPVSDSWRFGEALDTEQSVELPLTQLFPSDDAGTLILTTEVALDGSLSNAVLVVADPRYRVQVEWDDEVLLAQHDSHNSPVGSSPGEWLFIPISERLSQAGDHHLRISVKGEGGRVGLNGQVMLADAETARRLNRQQQTIELILPLAYAGMALCALVLAVIWNHRRDLLWLAFVCLGWMGFGLVESSLWWMFSDDLIWRLKSSLVFRSLIAVAGVRLYAWFALHRVPRFDEVLCWVNGLMAVVVMFWWGNSAALAVIEGFSALLVVLFLIRAFWLMFGVMESHRRDSYLMMTGLLMAGISFGVDSVVVLFSLPIQEASPIFAVGMGVCSLVALVSRLIEGNTRYEQLFEAAEDALLMVDLEGRIWEANRAATRFLGLWQPGDSLLSRLREVDQERCHAHIQGHEGGRRIELSFPVDSGEVTLESVAVDLESGRCLMTLRDITARRNMESGMLHTARMETVGSIAGGIAHDFNNTMTALLGQLGVLQSQVAHSHRGPIGKMESIILHASRMMQRLMAVSRGSVESQMPVEIEHLFRDVMVLSESMLPASIQVSLDMPDTPVQVMGAWADLEQVLLNLLMNGRDAIGNRTGQIWIEVKVEPSHSKHVEIVVEDSGTGIPLELREDVWRPFFTTKQPGRGSGLGLSLVARVIRDHGGQVSLTPPRHGTGCRVTMTLPLLSESPMGHEELRLQANVLLVEDDADIRKLIRGQLEEMGCTVHDYPDAEQALLFAQGEEIHLLVTDAVLPGMSGMTLASQLRTIQPALGVLVISAYLPENASLIAASWHSIAKPFTAQRLERAVRSALKN